MVEGQPTPVVAEVGEEGEGIVEPEVGQPVGAVARSGGGAVGAGSGSSCGADLPGQSAGERGPARAAASAYARRPGAGGERRLERDHRADAAADGALEEGRRGVEGGVRERAGGGGCVGGGERGGDGGGAGGVPRAEGRPAVSWRGRSPRPTGARSGTRAAGAPRPAPPRRGDARPGMRRGVPRRARGRGSCGSGPVRVGRDARRSPASAPRPPHWACRRPPRSAAAGEARPAGGRGEPPWASRRETVVTARVWAPAAAEGSAAGRRAAPGRVRHGRQRRRAAVAVAPGARWRWRPAAGRGRGPRPWRPGPPGCASGRRSYAQTVAARAVAAPGPGGPPRAARASPAAVRAPAAARAAAGAIRPEGRGRCGAFDGVLVAVGPVVEGHARLVQAQRGARWRERCRGWAAPGRARPPARRRGR